jgi:CRISPR-associated protein Cas4
MEPYIQITKLNDFIFCPHSLYLHTIYDEFENSTYTDVPQKIGKLKHETIDNNTYSTSRDWLQGMPVFSRKYGLAGKIDLYNQKTHALIDRKNKIGHIYEGYKYQLYAQYFALIEQGYAVKTISLHSLSDNKSYQVELPSAQDEIGFQKLVEAIKSYKPTQDPDISPKKCERCIYNSLCSYA